MRTLDRLIEQFVDAQQKDGIRARFREAQFILRFYQMERDDRDDADWADLQDWFRSLVRRVRNGDPEADVLAELECLVNAIEDWG
jgi:uncharacterized protein (DUF2236 family)